jgi:hypothetical protein
MYTRPTGLIFPTEFSGSYGTGPAGSNPTLELELLLRAGASNSVGKLLIRPSFVRGWQLRYQKVYYR